MSAPWDHQIVGCVMICLSCGSTKQFELAAEMLVHFPGVKNIDKPGVWLFPELLVCLDCGFSRFIVPAAELESVTNGTLANEPRSLEESAGDVAHESRIGFSAGS